MRRSRSRISASACGRFLGQDRHRGHDQIFGFMAVDEAHEPPLCDLCVDQRVVWLGGHAMARGGRWADSVANRTPWNFDQPWPAYDGSARGLKMVRTHIGDFAGTDERLFDRLARECWNGAARRWDELRRRVSGGRR